MTIQIPVQTIIDPKTDSGLTSYNTSISKVPTSVANVFVTSIQNTTTQINTQVNQTFTNANAAAGATTQVQFNDRGGLAGDTGFTYNKDTDSLTVAGNVTTATLRTNNLRYMNGDPMMFSYSNTNVASYLPTYSGNLSAGQVTALNFVGNGAMLSSLTGSQVTGNVPSANFASESNRANVVMSSSQPNITSVGTLVSLSVEGNITSNNIAASNSIYAPRIAGDGGNISNITGAFVTGVVGNAYFSTLAGTANTVSTNAQPNITSVGILTGLQVGGNLLASNADLGNMVYANYYAGDAHLLANVVGANVTGAVSNATNANVAITVSASAQPNITSVGTLTGLVINGNIEAGIGSFDAVSADYLIGDGSNITNLPSSSITGTVASAAQANVANVANTVAGANVTGTVANATQANIANVANTVAGANVTGTVADATHATVADSANTVAGANVTGTVANATFATTSGSSDSVAGANVLGQVSNALVSGTVYTNAQPNITSVGTLTSLAVSGNVTGSNITITGTLQANYVAGDAVNLSNIPAANINGSVANATHADTASTVTSSSQTNITSVGQLISLDVLGTTNANSITATGNISGNVITANLFVGSGANLSNIQSANIVGTVANATYATSAGSADSATTAGTVTTNAQPNITSVGTLAGLAVNGTTTLGAIGNVSISGGTDGQGISTDGTGNLSWVSFATQSYVANAIGDLINSAPNALNTLNELANALGNDASYASTITSALALKADISSLATVATSGSYTDLDNKPTIPSITGLATETYVDNKATWANITGKPTFATVATSGSYTDLDNKPTLGNIASINIDGSASNILYGNGVFAASPAAPDLSGYATTASLGNIASINLDGSTSNVLYGNGTFAAPPSAPDLTGYATESYVTGLGYITSSALTGYATTTYVDDKADWANITGKPTFATVATSGSYTDLDNKPTIPSITGLLSWTTVPATASSTGTAGQIAYDEDYFYICTATDTWVRTILNTWS
jgi:hypothetical protein